MARAAAEERAAYESRRAKIDTDLAVIKWMLGVVIAGVASLVIKVLPDARGARRAGATPKTHATAAGEAAPGCGPRAARRTSAGQP